MPLAPSMPVVVLADEPDAVQAEMESRWGPTRGKRGHAYTALRDTHSNLVSAGEGRTVDSHISVFGIEDTAAAPAYELAASALGRRAAVADNSASKPPRGQKLVTGSDADDLLLGAPPADQSRIFPRWARWGRRHW